MKPALSMLVLGVSVLILGCEGNDLAAPTEGLDPIDVVVTQRTAESSEPVPTVRVFGAVHGINFQVTTQASCNTLVSASYRAKEGHVVIVAHVGGDPRALCASIPASTVADYRAEIPDLDAGTYTVLVFEARGDAEPKFIGSGKGTSFAAVI